MQHSAATNTDAAMMIFVLRFSFLGVTLLPRPVIAKLAIVTPCYVLPNIMLPFVSIILNMEAF